jgi:anaerobic magnesium-protoporphyrin IX monomethyl ester cyclase
MKVLLINPPYQTITSNLGVGHQVPLGLLAIGGPLIDAGHEVRLLDAERRRMSLPAIARAVQRWGPLVVMTGHAGSTPAHATCTRMLRAIKARCPGVTTVYGGVYPSYHAEYILADEPAVDLIVRGEGEAISVDLLRALASGGPGVSSHLAGVPGIAFRAGGEVVLTGAPPPIPDLDAWRVGWELIEQWDDYQCFGMGRASIVQFSRGCPHRCTYCGQHGFWVKWRHRSPAKLADEIAWLHHHCGVRFITLADENPTTLRDQWRSFLEEIRARDLPVRFFATIRATDIVRDRDILPLYREAGILYVLMGIESTCDEVLQQIQKGSTTREDFQACRLLREHGIFSIIGHIVGFGGEGLPAFRTALRQLRLYDGDYLNAMYVTPHAWTPFAEEVQGRGVVQLDQSKWDYRHQVLAQESLRPWQLFLAVKWLELRFHLRVGRLWTLLRDRDRLRRRQRSWVYRHIGLVWVAEVFEFLFRTSFARRPVTLAERQRPIRSEHPEHLARSACETSRDRRMTASVSRPSPHPAALSVIDQMRDCPNA